ncbi:MAG: hypothetical protein CEE43_11760 [Promethearchaeota archaeon Loki_b32]|nr:MAG: hypothetical protein CEE43_11760 [Candidatus Lokiarchaeota archaeon Loki_b32]
MNLQTHILTGILIQIFCFRVFILPFDIVFTILFAFLSHFIIDAFVLITYHTSEPQKGDLFWISWQIISYGSGTILILFFLPYALGMLFANLIDIIDWLILRQIHRIKLKTEKLDWTKNYFFHNFVAKIRKYTLFWLPNWNYNKKGIIPEIIINIILIIGVILLRI